MYAESNGNRAINCATRLCLRQRNLGTSSEIKASTRQVAKLIARPDFAFGKEFHDYSTGSNLISNSASMFPPNITGKHIHSIPGIIGSPNVPA